MSCTRASLRRTLKIKVKWRVDRLILLTWAMKGGDIEWWSLQDASSMGQKPQLHFTLHHPTSFIQSYRGKTSVGEKNRNKSCKLWLKWICCLYGCFMFTLERMNLLSGDSLAITGTPCLNSRLVQFGWLDVYYDRFITSAVKQPQDLWAALSEGTWK